MEKKEKNKLIKKFTKTCIKNGKKTIIYNFLYDMIKIVEKEKKNSSILILNKLLNKFIYLAKNKSYEIHFGKRKKKPINKPELLTKKEKLHFGFINLYKFFSKKKQGFIKNFSNELFENIKHLNNNITNFKNEKYNLIESNIKNIKYNPYKYEPKIIDEKKEIFEFLIKKEILGKKKKNELINKNIINWNRWNKKSKFKRRLQWKKK